MNAEQQVTLVVGEPYEIRYRHSGKRTERCVIGALCPRPVPLLLGMAKPIYVEMGDVKAHWDEVPSPGLQLLLQTGMGT